MRSIASDTVLIEKGKILLIKRGNEPFKDMWALPGGRVENNETTEECAIREMKEETGLQVKIIKLIGVYSDPKRDPRGIVSVAYLVKRISGSLKSGDDAKEAKWFELVNLPKLAFDHEKIIKNVIILQRTPKSISFLHI